MFSCTNCILIKGTIVIKRHLASYFEQGISTFVCILKQILIARLSGMNCLPVSLCLRSSINSCRENGIQNTFAFEMYH